ncbi:MAG: hypothetical protein EXX96DRAFT_535024 [Benjaminiella poitrasii]|nr:MAG: hypothetical protein EXX96DRAFT_535024 [Benjaminiella poitrasii]
MTVDYSDFLENTTDYRFSMKKYLLKLIEAVKFQDIVLNNKNNIGKKSMLVTRKRPGIFSPLSPVLIFAIVPLLTVNIDHALASTTSKDMIVLTGCQICYLTLLVMLVSA